MFVANMSLNNLESFVAQISNSYDENNKVYGKRVLGGQREMYVVCWKVAKKTVAGSRGKSG